MKALIDLHTHTIGSGHAYSTIKENIEEAQRIGLSILGTSDHAPAMPGAAEAMLKEVDFPDELVVNYDIDKIQLVLCN